MTGQAAMASPHAAPSLKAPPAATPMKSRSLAQVPHLPCQIAQVATTFGPEDGLSPEFLRHYCASEDLSEVSRLEIQVDAAAQNIEAIGQHLVNLQHLKLQNSSVLSIRDFGTGLQNLRVLWMSRCGLQDLGGLASSLPVLREFYVPFNQVADLSPLSWHDALEVLDIEGNGVGDREEVRVLQTCPRLRELTLSGNPVLRSALSRKDVLGMLPSLEVLDDVGSDQQELDAGSTRAPTSEDAEPDPEFDLKLMLADVAVARGASPPSRRVPHDEDFQADLCDSDDDSCSIESIPDPRPRPDVEIEDEGDDEIRPLISKHPLLAAGLLKSAAQSKGASPYDGEPDDEELVMDRLKIARPVQQHGFTDRAFSSSWGGRGMVDRRQASTEPSTFRPATSAGTISGLQLDDLFNCDTSSKLTRGEGSLAGGPLDLLRHRRNDSAGLLSGKAEMDIRELMRRYQTYTQPTKKPELCGREVGMARLATPDVRIRSLKDASSSSGRPGSTGGRPKSSGGVEGPFGNIGQSANQAKRQGPALASSTPDRLVL